MSEGLTVLHLVDAAGGDSELWGKERIILWLAEAQKNSGDVQPLVRTLTPKLLTAAAADAGIDSSALTSLSRRNLVPYARALKGELAHRASTVVHSHGYKANLVARLARMLGGRALGWIATCHGWVDTSAALRMYNALDRWTSRFSDLVTAPSQAMLRRLPAGSVAVPNGIPDCPPPTRQQRDALRRRWDFAPEDTVVGVLGRLSPEKGIEELLEAARLTRDDHRLIWALAGTGPLEEVVNVAARELVNVKVLGYVDGSDEFLPAIDVYVQPSRTEGLSLGLLEATRAGLPIVATRVGATDWAVRDEREALLLPPNDAGRLAQTVTKVASDRSLRERLGRQARKRFEEALDIRVMHGQYLELYRKVLAKRQSMRHNTEIQESTP